MICSRAPGKIILFGEHFVVKGMPAIATAVNLYAKTCIESSDKHVIESKNLGIINNIDEHIDTVFKPYYTIYEVIKKKTGIDKGFHAIIDSEIPVASGMGSSAATAVSFTYTLLKYYGVEPSLELVNQIAYEAEKIVHGKPSGIDNTIATYGGTIYYRKGFIERLDVTWPENISLIVVDTGVKRNTGEVVSDVLKLYDKYSEVFEPIYRASEKLVEMAKKYLVANEFYEIGELTNINHGLLSAINVSIYDTEYIVYKLREIGALGSKISGAGRGGIVFGLFDKEVNKEQLHKLFLSKGYKYTIVKPVNIGVETI